MDRLAEARAFTPEWEDWGVLADRFHWGPTFGELVDILRLLAPDGNWDGADPFDIDVRAEGFAWVGTLEELMTGGRPFENDLRRRYRTERSRKGGAGPIAEGDHDDFVASLAAFAAP